MLRRQHANSPVRITLASQSPRRRQLLRTLVARFDTVNPRVAETKLLRRWRSLPPREIAQRLALAKARAAARTVKTGVIVAADTLVALRGEIIGKPRNDAHARAILAKLSGTIHDTITGVAILDVDRKRIVTFAESTRVTMRRLPPQTIAAYVASGESRGKAGAYAIQQKADRFVLRLKGSWSNVVGLPLERLKKQFKRLQILP